MDPLPNGKTLSFYENITEFPVFVEYTEVYNLRLSVSVELCGRVNAHFVFHKALRLFTVFCREISFKAINLLFCVYLLACAGCLTYVGFGTCAGGLFFVSFAV